jgi:TonB-linked SusC/RagA family outer membrane protein
LLLAAAICLSAQAGYSQHSVTGTVSDATGTLPGVNVSVKGTTRGMSSDIDGRYAIDVPGPNAVLVFSFIGYVSQEVRVGDRHTIDMIMKEDSRALEEVVVVGYGVQKKVSLTGSVAMLNTDDIRDVASSNLLNTLAGRLTGVTIKQNSGGRPGNGANIVVRARETWNSTDPLYVIDGVARDAAAFNMLSSADIESLSVLKDASTAAIYGSRGANGVVMVTTKRGESGRPVISYSGSVSAGTGFSVLPHRETAAERISWINDYNREVLVNPNSMNIPYNASNGIRYWPTIFREDGVTPISSGVFTPDEQEYYMNHSYDLLDELWNTPITSTHSVSVSGGTDRVRYFVAGNYYDETGGIKTLTYNKFSVRSNIEAEMGHGLAARVSKMIYINNQ